MKKVLLTIISICLIVASIFGLYSGVLGLKDALNIQKYKTADGAAGLEQIDEELLPGIDQLMENLNVYLDGVSQVEDGKAQLADGYAQYAAGQAALAAGAQQLREGEAALAAGKAELAANTDAYNEGKALISQMESFMPLIEGIANAAQNVRDFNAGLPLVGETIDTVGGQLRAAVMNLLANSAAVSAISNMVGMDIGSLLASNPTDTSICGNVVAMYYDGLAQLKLYEDGQAQVAAGEAQLAQGYADYAAGQQQLAEGAAQLADGEAQLADGLAQLSVFEQGEITLAAGLTRLLTQPSYENNYVGQVFYDGDLFYKDMVDQIFTTLLDNIQDEDARATVAASIYPGFYGTDDTSMWSFPTREGDGGDVICKSVLDIVREKIPGFNPVTDLFAKNDDGSVRVENGYPLVDLNVAKTIAESGREYIDVVQTGAVTSEVMGKLVGTVLMMVAALLGLIAGLLGLFRKGAFAGFGFFSCLFALAALVFTFIKKGFKGYGFGLAQKFEIGDDGLAATAWPWGHNVRDGANAISGNQVITGSTQLKAILIMAIVALLFWLIALLARKAIKAAKAQKYSYTAPVAPAAAAPQPVAQPVYAAPVAEPVVEKVVVTEPVVETPVVEKVVVTEPVVEKVVVKTPAEIYAEAAAKAAAAQAAADAAAAEAAAAKAAADAAAAAAAID